MRLFQVVYLIFLSACLAQFTHLAAQGESEAPASESFVDMAAIEAFLDAATSESQELGELRDRLRQIESMLLSQKDRENELLRDLNRFVIASQDKPDESEAAEKELAAIKDLFRTEASALQLKIANLESSVAAGHERDIQMGQEMNKTIIVTVSIVAGLGLFVFLVTVFLQFKLISRPVQPIYMQPQASVLEAGGIPQLPGGRQDRASEVSEMGLVENTKVADTNEKFVSAIERLEEKISQMEAGLARAEDVFASGSDHPDPLEVDAEVEKVYERLSENEKDQSVVDISDEKDVEVLEAEGKRHLQQEDWKTAFLHYEQLVRLDSDRVENWVNRGRALEMLKREEEAILSYDKAIDTNPDLPSPFLYKAALLSRMERFEEAQKFYNEALSKVPVQKGERVTASAVD